MARQALFALSILLVFLFDSITTLAQPATAPALPATPPIPVATPPTPVAKPPTPVATPPTPVATPPTLSATPPSGLPAKAPAQSAQIPVQKGPTDVVKILEKAKGYSVFIRLLKSTGLAGQLYGQLNNSNVGFTIFAPTDGAFSSLKAGTINSLSDLQKTQLIQFHILNTVVTLSNFQTLSNPVPTEAGDTSAGEFPLNVTTAGNQVNISTGLVNATLGGTIYSDNQLIMYRVDKVLLPLDIFVPKTKKAAAPAATLAKPNGTADAADSPSGGDAAGVGTDDDAAKVDHSGAVRLSWRGTLLSIGVSLVAFIVTKAT
ncbi:hypothetical protein F2P56_011181 [Juglans regia]|uniref:Fasciclin-like arabinogalactan protein 12 n=2 Tax=Juglans regia TaxID=51240 RepID=A0A2I4DVZ1_JUGRE|nr:fasciclin-like arabinogalactan protein 12 [Juglans regia]KAF5470684.1 hypothetical protein F2P56_011181 [Juglans regia]